MDELLKRARSAADQAEVMVAQTESQSVEFDNNELKYVTTRSQRGAGLRVIKNGRIGFASTTDLADPGRLVAGALESAAFGQEAKFSFPAAAECPAVKTFDPAVADYKIEDAVELGRAAIDKIRGEHDDAMCNVQIERAVETIRVLNTAGLDVSCDATGWSYSVHGFVVHNSSFLSAGDGNGSSQLELRIDECADLVVRDLHRARQEVAFAPGKYPVIFTPRSIGTLLMSFTYGINGKAVQKGMSPLIDRIGELVLDPRVTISDDATVDFAEGSFPWDGEGVPTRRTMLFDKGVLKSYVLDLQTAGMLGLESTGNASRMFSSQPTPGVNNLIVEPGTLTLDEMIGSMASGIVVEQVLGGGQSNVIAGEFSINVDLGFLVDEGEIVGRVKDCMIAGNVYDAFNNIAAIGSESEFRGSTRCPAVQFESLTVAGG